MHTRTNTYAKPSPRDRVKGILIGLAAGDRNGGPIRMASHLTTSLLALERFDRADVLQRYLGWWHNGAFDTGPIAAHVFTLIDAGIPPNEAPARIHAFSAGMTAGCNPAHRSVPLAMAAFLTDDKLRQCATEEAALTHWDPLAGDVAAATADLCRALIHGSSWPDALRTASAGCTGITRTALSIPAIISLRSDGFAPAVLQAAVHFVHMHSHFAAALDSALAFAGPANYCPVLVGAIGGARWGASSIPSQYLDHCAVLADIQGQAETLAQQWPSEV